MTASVSSQPLGGSRQCEKVSSEVSSIPVPSLELIYRPNGWLASLAEKITFEALINTEILTHWYWKSVRNCARGSSTKFGLCTLDFLALWTGSATFSRQGQVDSKAIGYVPFCTCSLCCRPSRRHCASSQTLSGKFYDRSIKPGRVAGWQAARTSRD